MKPEKLRCIKRLLLKRLNELQFKIGQSVFEQRAMDNNPADVMDKASIEFDQSVEMTMRGRERMLLRELQGAIMRIDRGAFGVCEACEGQISEGRLLARPTSRLCFACMRKQEKYRGGARHSLDQMNCQAV